MTVTREDIAAYVDGELDDTARARVANAALTDAALAARIADEQQLRETLRAHFAPIAAEPAPADWIATIRAATAAAPQDKPSAPVISLAAVRAERESHDKPLRRAPAMGWFGAAIAASLVVGMVLGGRLQPQGPIVASGNALMAAGDLAQALDTHLATADGAAPVRMLGTFRRQGGDLCRAFSGAVASGIACRAGDQWQMQRVLPGVPVAGSAYRQAGSADGELMAEAQAMAAGDPLDAAQERAAQARGWH